MEVRFLGNGPVVVVVIIIISSNLFIYLLYLFIYINRILNAFLLSDLSGSVI